MCDLIYEVGLISCCVWSCDTGKINVCDKIMIQSQKEKIWNSKKFFLHKSPRKNCFEWNSQLLRRADARRNAADIIYRMWRISLLYGSDYDADADANFGCHSLSRL